MSGAYVHGYDERANERLHDQAQTLAELLHHDTSYPAGSRVLEAGCGVGAQTVTLARHSPEARITSIDVSAGSLAAAARKAEADGITNVDFRQADSSTCRSSPSRSSTSSSASCSSISRDPSPRSRS
jgi:ubiquinone/menaquinone biosynthesis C-methylase UbiE